MNQLSDTQLVILSAAAQREDRNVLPLPGSLRGGAATKVVGALLKRGMIAETTTDDRTGANNPLNRIWRADEDGYAVLLHITDAGLAAIGVETESGDSAPTGADDAPSAEAPTDTPDGAGSAAAFDTFPTKGTPADQGAWAAWAESLPAPTPPAQRTHRANTKQAQMIAMLEAPEGATIAEIAEATGRQHHTVRGAFAGALKKKLGLTIESEKVEGRGRVYRIAG